MNQTLRTVLMLVKRGLILGLLWAIADWLVRELTGATMSMTRIGLEGLMNISLVGALAVLGGFLFSGLVLTKIVKHVN